MAAWVAGKLSRPAIRQAFGYLQERMPNSALVSEAARVATSDNPLAPTSHGPLQTEFGSDARAAGVPPSAEEKSQGLAGDLRGRAQKRAQTFALGKVQSVVWAQVCLPLTAILWVISLILAFFESRAVARAQVPKDAASHDRDVQAVVAAVKARPANKQLVVKPTSSHVSHVLRGQNAKQEIGPASALKSSASVSSGGGPVGALRPMHAINLSKLTRVLSVDEQESMCEVEAACTFRDLVRATTAHRLMPAVVPPFPEQTVGGAFVGGGVNSGSFRVGNFAACVTEVKVVLGNGDLVRVTREGDQSELFCALASSFHTIGTVVSLKVQLVRAPRYLHMKYENFNKLDKAVARMQALVDSSSSAILGVEAIAFSATNITLAVCSGVDVIDTTHHTVQQFTHSWDTPFYSYLRAMSVQLQNRDIRALPTTHCIPLQDYLWRYDNRSFWLGEFVFHLLPWPLTGDNFISRLLVGFSVSDSKLRATLHQDPESMRRLAQLRLVQDAHVPLAHVARWTTWQLGALGVAPLWLCPVRASRQQFLDPSFQHASIKSDDFCYVNVGVYGRPHPHVPFNAQEVNEELVEQVYRAGGRTMLHSLNWHTPELFQQMYDSRRYERVREQYSAAQAYPHLFDKVSLNDSDRAAMRVPFDQPERPLLDSMKNKIITHGLKFWA